MRGISWLGYPIRLDEVSLAGQNCDTSLFRSIEMIANESRSAPGGGLRSDAINKDDRFCPVTNCELVAGERR